MKIKVFPLVLFSLAFLAGGDMVPARQLAEPVPPAPAPIAVEAPIDWDLANEMLAQREAVRRASGHEEYPEWSDYSEAYFRALIARRASIQAWTVSRPEPPTIVFIGDMHGDPRYTRTPEEEVAHVRGQEAEFERLRHHAQGASVIAIEDAGLEGVVTRNRFVTRMRRSLAEEDGLHLSIGEIRARLSQAGARVGIGARAILALDVPVIHGEEWPLTLESRIRTEARPTTREDMIVIGGYFIRSMQLRSEIILIRTLEHLRRVDGSRGVIVQGDTHRPQAEALAPEYHIRFISIPPG